MCCTSLARDRHLEAPIQAPSANPTTRHATTPAVCSYPQRCATLLLKACRWHHAGKSHLLNLRSEAPQQSITCSAEGFSGQLQGVCLQPLQPLQPASRPSPKMSPEAHSTLLSSARACQGNRSFLAGGLLPDVSASEQCSWRSRAHVWAVFRACAKTSTCGDLTVTSAGKAMKLKNRYTYYLPLGKLRLSAPASLCLRPRAPSRGAGTKLRDPERRGTSPI